MSFDYADGRARPSSPRSLLGPLVLLILAAAALAWVLGFFGFRAGRTSDPDAAARPVTARGDLAADEKATIELFERDSPSVVHITTGRVDRFGFETDSTPTGTGSGFVWDESGYIVTNAHVVLDATKANVILSDGTTYEALPPVRAAPDYDLAVFKVNTRGRKLPAIPVGTSADLKVGQKVFAIGHPYGLEQTLTTGVISALGRQIRSLSRNRLIEGVIQTDAAINPGNSGGPLLDSAGRLIGVNTQIVSPNGGGFVGIGFAIPVDTVNQVIPELIRGNRVNRPVLGVRLADEALARKLGVDSGALIWFVIPGGPAEEAGLRASRQVNNGRITPGDAIIRFDGQPVKTGTDLIKLLGKRKVGDVVKLGVRRGTEEIEVEVTLGEG